MRHNFKNGIVHHNDKDDNHNHNDNSHINHNTAVWMMRIVQINVYCDKDSNDNNIFNDIETNKNCHLAQKMNNIKNN